MSDVFVPNCKSASFIVESLLACFFCTHGFCTYAWTYFDDDSLTNNWRGKLCNCDCPFQTFDLVIVTTWQSAKTKDKKFIVFCESLEFGSRHKSDLNKNHLLNICTPDNPHAHYFSHLIYNLYLGWLQS